MERPERAAARSRMRSKRACDSCRQRKRKCDGNHPCAGCVRYEYECTYPESTRRKRAKNTNDILTATTTNDGEERYPALSPASSGRPPRPDDVHSDDFPSRKSVPRSSIASPEMTQYKCRFMGVGSAVSFARDVGVDLQMSNVPRLHSFAWNTGIRQENESKAELRITKLISFSCSQRFSQVYFRAVNPLFHLLKVEEYDIRCAQHWHGANAGADFEAVAGGVVALGSLFSPSTPCKVEAEVVEHSRIILDAAISQPPTTLSLDIVIGWILRALYQRLTTRATISWMSINTAMHLTEATGLHQEIIYHQDDKHAQPRLLNADELEARRRIFWVAWSLNRFFAAELGRSRVNIDNIRCHKPVPREGDYIDKLVALAELIPDNVGYTVNTGVEVEMKLLSEKLLGLGNDPPVFSLLKADVCFQYYRRLRLLRVTLKGDEVEFILCIIRSSIAEARKLCADQQPWWNVLSTTFQSLLVLISINSTSSIGLIPEITQALGEIVTVYDTHLAREALRTSQQMIRKLLENRREEVCALENASLEMESAIVQPISDLGSDTNLFEGMTVDNLAWTQFFRPDLTDYNLFAL